jgi:hypothetical protein
VDRTQPTSSPTPTPTGTGSEFRAAVAGTSVERRPQAHARRTLT